MIISYKTHKCSVGYVLAAICSDGLFAVTLGKTKQKAIDHFYEMLSGEIVIGSGEGDKYDLVSLVANTIDHPHSNALDEIVRGNHLVTEGTDFQKKVWKAIRSIPIGETMTYGAVAKMIGHPKAVRAVASACATNRFAFIVPCHRVVGSKGKLCGYRWGLDIKKQLLVQEAA